MPSPKKKTKGGTAVRCKATGPNAPFLNGVKMKDQVCGSEEEAARLVATGLFEYADAADLGESEDKGDDDASS